MHDDLDGLLARLAAQPAPLRLNGLEARVGRSLREERSAPSQAWRFAAVGMALFVGVGMGSTATPPQHLPLTADLSGSIRFAPSTLLDAST